MSYRAMTDTKVSFKAQEKEDVEESHHSSLREEGDDNTAPKKEEKASTEKKKSGLAMALDYFKYVCSFVLLIFSVFLVMNGIFSRESTADDYGIPPIASFFLFWYLICWLAMMEGGQGCLVGLQPVEKHLYLKSHPRAHKNTTLVHEGDNMERFIVGRQFLAVLVIFLINLCGAAKPGTDPFGLPSIVNEIFLGNGVAMMITTIILGQLTSQVNAAVCMLDFINNYFMLFTSYASLAIEYSGLLHCVYLVQYAFALFNGEPVYSNEPPRNTVQKIFFWLRVLISTVILGFAFAVTLTALVKEQSGMWEGVPVWLSILIFFIFLCVVGLMEGMQIAAFALINMPKEELKTHKVAAANCQLMFEGNNLQAFLIGRQMLCAALMFIVAKIATISIPEGESNIFGVSDGLQKFLDTGLLGAVILTIIGSLAWRVVASSMPLMFMSNPAVYVIIRIALILEATGICSATWLLASVNKRLAKYKCDDEHLMSDRRAKMMSMKSQKSVAFRSSKALMSGRNGSSMANSVTFATISVLEEFANVDLDEEIGDNDGKDNTEPMGDYVRWGN